MAPVGGALPSNLKTPFNVAQPVVVDFAGPAVAVLAGRLAAQRFGDLTLVHRIVETGRTATGAGQGDDEHKL